MSFRLNSFKFEQSESQTPKVDLTNHPQSDDNYFTIIIGNNGTGKSRFLRGIANTYKRNLKFQNKNDHKTLPLPRKVIAVTTSLSDKFPIDYSFNQFPKQHIKSSQSAESSYCYLGPRGRIGGASSRALMTRAVSSLISKSQNKELFYQYKRIFEYLNYEPVLKIVYKVAIPNKLRESSHYINGSVLKDYFKDQVETRSGIREGIYKRFLDKNINYWDELADAYNYAYTEQYKSRKREFSFLINFSNENINRNKDIISSSEITRYEVFDDLRKLDLIKSMRVKLYKKNGGEFDFTDASSGEASILSTLIGLVPNLESDSLLLIDEPEISLHPSWQYRYIELIDRLMQSVSGCHIIIATHSHFLISDLPNGRSNIVHFKLADNNNIEVDYYSKNTNGMSAEDILLNIFDMPSTRNYYLSSVVTELLELLAEGDKKSDKFRKLLNKVKQVYPNLKTIDPLHDVIKKLIELG